MRTLRIAIPVLVITFVLGGVMPSGMTATQAQPLACPPDCPYSYYLPLITKPYGIFQGELTIDHTNIDITQIPDAWLVKARDLTFHFAHTSHGGQIFDGLGYLYNEVNSKYDYAISYDSPPTLPSGTNILKFYDGNNYVGNSYITPDMYWEGSDGIAHTLSTVNTGLFNYSMWSWCGQVEYDSDDQINEYLAQMKAFDDTYPAMRFILMTGHNVSYITQNNDSLQAHNQMIRDYAASNNLVLFDFADIETHDPDGNYYDPGTYEYYEGDCTWCHTWCTTHTSYCTNLPSCAHVDSEDGGLICKMKAQAFWWMMARLAGWPGPF